MNCPRCGAHAKVIDSRKIKNCWTRRRKECDKGHRFSTYEIDAFAMKKLQDSILSLSKLIPGLPVDIRINGRKLK